MSLLLGFLLIPQNAMACKIKPEKYTPAKKTLSKDPHQQCCEQQAVSGKKKKSHCPGKCKAINCMCNCPANSTLAISWLAPKEGSLIFCNEKQKFHDIPALLLAGYSSVWLIPKIV